MGIFDARISRREALRAAGAILSLPLLESTAAGRARATGRAARPPLRMGIFTVTGGTVLESWKPAQVGALTTLPSILRPLESIKEELLVLSGLSHSGRSENLNAHEHCAYMHLTAAASVKREAGKPFAAISVDQLAAQKIGGQTLLPSIEIGLGSHENKYSFRDMNTPVPYEANPRFVFDRMFRGRKPVAPNWSRRGAAPSAPPQKGARSDSLDQSVIDLVLDQAKELRGRLGRIDQEKLDGYLASVRSVESRIHFLEARLKEELQDGANPGPSRVNIPTLYAEGVPFYKIHHEIYRDPEKHAEYIRIMAELMTLAFQTDTTRVAVLAAGSDEASFPGVVTVGYERHCHTLEHQGNASKVEDADPIAREACRQIHAWYTELFAEMARKMKQIDEGGSTLLDNTMLLYTSYMADGGHGVHDYPALLAGRAGGAIRPGRHVAFQPNTPVANLYVEMLDRMGAHTDTFGDSKTSKNAAYGGRLPGLV